MPYKDLNKRKECSKKRKDTQWIKDKFPIVQKIQSYSIEDKSIYLLDINQRTRIKMYKNFIIPFSDQIEKEIDKLRRKRIYQRSKPRRNEKWNFVKKWMVERGCSCGENNITKLSFHHLDPSQKDKEIRRMCSHSMKRLTEELKKGVVKCKNCHTIVHNGNSEQREETLINQYFNKKSNKKWEHKNKLSIWEYKKTLSCVKCGISDPVILLFHHITGKLG